MAKRAAVRIGDLKNNLSAHLQRVRKGEEMLICDRDAPIARIVPLSQGEDFTEEEQALAAEGKLRLSRTSSSKAAWDAFWKLPAPKVDVDRALEALRADREGR
jgi:antitoxin (DNA-binding transcriptional repressor) of toxin-antitoxin stability system